MFVIVEIITVQLATVWFAIGAIGAVAANLLGAPMWLQLVVFVVLSLASLAISRPYVKKFTKTRIQPTNADMLIGESAVVTADIRNTFSEGEVTIRGLVWTARSADGNDIPKGSVVTIDYIEGAKLIVSASAAEQPPEQSEKPIQQ